MRATVQFRTPVSPKGTVRVHHISEPVVKTQVKYEPVQIMYTISNSQSINPSIGLPRNLSSYLFELSRKSNFPNRRGSDLSFPSVDRPILALARSPHRTALHLPVPSSPYFNQTFVHSPISSRRSLLTSNCPSFHYFLALYTCAPFYSTGRIFGYSGEVGRVGLRNRLTKGNR